MVRWTTLALAVVALIAAVVWYLNFGDVAHPFARPAPTSGRVEVGVEYRVTLYCGFGTIQLGDYVWQVKGKPTDWPPAIPDPGKIISPYPVPGSLTLSSPTQAVFVADVNGSRFRVMRLEPYRDIYQLGPMCI